MGFVCAKVSDVSLIPAPLVSPERSLYLLWGIGWGSYREGKGTPGRQVIVAFLTDLV